MISKEEVRKIAKLSRLELTEKEIEKMQRELSEILDYFEALKNQKATTKNQSRMKKTENRLREDAVAVSDASLAGDIVNAAPEEKDGYIKVKAVL